MSWGSGFAALLGAGALFWTIGNSVRRDTKAEVASLADSTDRKIAANADAIAANARDIANMRESMAKGFADMREVHDRDMGCHSRSPGQKHGQHRQFGKKHRQT